MNAITCPQCRTASPAGTRLCPSCGYLLSWTKATATAAKSPAAREQAGPVALQQEIARYVKQGYRIQFQTETTAQLIKPKSFSILGAILGAVILYGLYYLSKRDRIVYLEIDAQGRVTAIKR